MAKNFYGAIALTGGGTGALDKIDGADLADLDAAFVQVFGTFYAYTLDDDSGAAEDSPRVISPDTNAGTKRWLLQDVGVIVVADSAPSTVFKGLLWYDTDATGSAVTSTVNVTTYSSSITIAADDVFVLAGDGVFTLTLPTAVGIEGKRYWFIDNSSSGDTVTVAADGSETINGNPTKTMTGQYQQFGIISDGSNWLVIIE